MSNRAIKIFFSYSRKDLESCDRLYNHLKPLEIDSGRALLWRDTNMPAGERWSREIEQQIRTADIILLLISSNFLGSEYCYQRELEIALNREKRHEATVIPISMGAINWDSRPFSYLNALPTNRTPIVSAPGIADDRLLTDVAKGIESTVNAIARQNIKAELGQLKQEPTLKALHLRLNSVETACEQAIHSTEVYEYFVEALNAVKAEIEQGVSLRSSFYNATKGSFFESDRYSEDQRIAMEMFRGLYQQEMASSPIERATSPDSSDKPIDVHVVLLALTRAEAEELDSLSAFEGQPTSRLENNFREFRSQLEENFPNWKDSYGNSPELWQPLSIGASEATNLDALVTTALDIAEERLSTTYKREISLNKKYQYIRDLHETDNQQILDELREDDCLIIIDAVSLHHPEIFRAFQRSLLDVYHNTFVATYAPDGYLLKSLEKTIVALEFPIRDMGFLQRQDPDRVTAKQPAMACVTTSEETRLRSWLNNQMYITIDNKSFRKSGVHERFFEVNEAVTLQSFDG